MPAPTLTTPRLRLRAHVMADLEALCDVLGSGRARFMGGPVPRVPAWRWLASEVAMWELMGHGSWGIEAEDGRFLGQISINQPSHFPEPELGWTLLQAAEGKGYAQEAATAVLHWARAQGFGTLVSYISPGNDRSIALARWLGAEHDPEAALPEGETAEDTVVYRHAPDAGGIPEAHA